MADALTPHPRGGLYFDDFEGDAMGATTEAAAKRESLWRADAGLVDLRRRASKPDATLIAERRGAAVMLRRRAAAVATAV